LPDPFRKLDAVAVLTAQLLFFRWELLPTITPR
jgi:hypothetical protein